MNVLGMVFTKGVSLRLWVEKGLIDREKLIYEKHIETGVFDKIIWFTYGKDDLKYYNQLISENRISDKIEVIPIPKYFASGLGQSIYSFALPLLQKKVCSQLDVIKTNQMPGAWAALLISKIYKIPFFLRTGYTHTQICDINRKKKIKFHHKLRNGIDYYVYSAIERILYKKCDVASVSSLHDKKYIENKYKVFEKVNILPNYIDCNLFNQVTPYNDRQERFLFVGRLSHEKNLFNTIEGVCTAGYGIDIYGGGGLDKELQDFISDNGYDATLKGSVDNARLPEVYNSYKYYILASPFEGMPKTLLEAMACGCLCFGTNSSGIKEVIKAGENGFLFDSTAVQDISYCIANSINSSCGEIAVCASKYIKTNYSINKIVEVEQDLIKSCMG